MPRKNNSLRKRSKKTTNSVAKLSKQMLALKTSLKPELKYHDQAAAVTFLAPDNFYRVVLNQTTQAVNDISRIGNTIKCKWVSVKVDLLQQDTLTTATTPQAGSIRIVLLLSKSPMYVDPTDVTPGYPTYLLSQAVGSAIDSYRDPASKEQWSVLHDKVYTPDTNSDTRTMRISINKRLNFITQQDATNNVITRGTIWLVMYRNQFDPVAPAPTPLLTSYQSRVYFSDV